MKFSDKELVEGTQPPIRIGKRVFKKASGEQRTTDTYWATFSINGKQSFIPLKVFKRADAIRAAHRLAQKIEVGEPSLQRSESSPEFGPRHAAWGIWVAVALPRQPFRVMVIPALACLLHDATKAISCCLPIFVCLAALFFIHAYLLAIDALSFEQMSRGSFWHGRGRSRHD